jgi:hypothetical protein
MNKNLTSTPATPQSQYQVIAKEKITPYRKREIKVKRKEAT